MSARELLRGTRGNVIQTESQVITVTSKSNGTSVPALPSNCDSASIRRRVQVARAVQQRRFADRPRVRANADMGLADLDAFCRLNPQSTALLQQAVESFSLSARAAHRCLRVARTIADLADTEEIALEHVAEAVQYQVLDRLG